ncbi:hypothetical protein QQF64_016467 [Cirrhinus molitorella]|uniref:Uncharacterized protein n=1 Tax=Cirrhinus molitorella TaxID=172907 RepID=A0ABR3LS08_9TELE
MPPKCRRKTQLKGEVAKRSRTSTSQLAAVTRIRTGVAAATTQSTNHYTITARHWFTAGGAGRPNTKRASRVSAFGWQGGARKSVLGTRKKRPQPLLLSDQGRRLTA